MLPSREGLQRLEALALWLKSHRQENWRVRVSARAVDGGVDAQRLADKRLELLQRFFNRQGLAAEQWQWQATAGEDFQVQLSAKAATP